MAHALIVVSRTVVYTPAGSRATATRQKGATVKKSARLFVGAGAAVGALGLLASPAFAHDCFNPNKPVGAGVNYTITGFNGEEPIFEQTGPGKGVGGFIDIAPGVFGNPVTVEVHSIGNSQSHEEVGGPGSQKPEHACDGQGIDYIDVCFG